MKILVTGGCGFIGSHVVRQLAREGHHIVNFDKLTYAGNPANVADLAGLPNYTFNKGDICDAAAVHAACEGVDGIINLAAETHVDRSILEPGAFIRTDMMGAYVLLEEARARKMKFFTQVSTDEVYGSIESGFFTEESPTRPRNPYSASKLGGERLVYSYFTTYGLPVTITRGSNTYGPNQYPEKLIPLTILRALAGEPIPVYGDGKNVRDWIHAVDHASAICAAALKGKSGEVYNIAGENEEQNIHVVREILKALGRPETLIRFVKDREGHDRRYAMKADKIKRELGWTQTRGDFDAGLTETVRWYVEHESWWKPLIEKNKDFQEYFQKQYGNRL